MGTLLTSTHHDDALRHAAQMRRLQPRPKAARTMKVDAKPSIRSRLAAAFRTIPTRHAGT
jgi:hypothetical protein